MDAPTMRPEVEKLFSRARRRSVGAAVEQELFAVCLMSGASVAPDRVREATAGRAHEPWVSFEPGGQVELSLPRAPHPDAAAAQLRAVTAELGADLQARGILLRARPVRDRDPNTPRYLRTPRYDALERHLDRIGPAGRRMMRSTASTQVCLDWWPGRAGLEQWRVLHLAAPFLAAVTCAGGPGSRLATWLEVDPARTAFDGRLLDDEDPVAAYTSFAIGAEDVLGRGVATHLSTLFPPVRPRGRYLEIRFPDARRSEEVGALVSGLAGLLYDDERRRSALADLAGERARLAEHWAAAAAGCGDAERGAVLLTGSSRAAEVAA